MLDKTVPPRPGARRRLRKAPMFRTFLVLKQIAGLTKLSQDELIPDGRQPRELKLAAIPGNGPMVREEQGARSGFKTGTNEAHHKVTQVVYVP